MKLSKSLYFLEFPVFFWQIAETILFPWVSSPFYIYRRIAETIISLRSLTFQGFGNYRASWPSLPIVAKTLKSQESQGNVMVSAIILQKTSGKSQEIEWYRQLVKKVRKLKEINRFRQFHQRIRCVSLDLLFFFSKKDCWNHSISLSFLIYQ